MRSAKTVLAVLGAVTVLVLAGNTVALATTGHALLSGKVNSSGKATTVKRTTRGAALVARTKSSADAPFAVNGHGRVPNLNADYVDGLTSLSLRHHSYVFDAKPESGQRFIEYKLPVPDGSYVVSYTAYLEGLGGSGGVDCTVWEDHGKSNGGVGTAFSSLYANNSYDTSLSASGLVTKSPSSTLLFSCGTQNANQTFSISDDIPLRIVLTPTAIVAHKTITQVPVEDRNPTKVLAH